VVVSGVVGARSALYDWCPLGYSKIESTVRHPGIEVDDAIEIAEIDI
jgi:hypothetical protein